jgi:hypothetical protein
VIYVFVVIGFVVVAQLTVVNMRMAQAEREGTAAWKALGVQLGRLEAAVKGTPVPASIPQRGPRPGWLVLVDADDREEITRVAMPAKRPRTVKLGPTTFVQCRTVGDDVVYRAEA